MKPTGHKDRSGKGEALTISITCRNCRRTKSAKVDRVPADLETVLKALEYSTTDGGFLCVECERATTAKATA